MIALEYPPPAREALETPTVPAQQPTAAQAQVADYPTSPAVAADQRPPTAAPARAAHPTAGAALHRHPALAAAQQGHQAAAATAAPAGLAARARAVHRMGPSPAARN